MKTIRVYNADVEDQTVLAVLDEAGIITGTDNPDLVQRIQAAVKDPIGCPYDPRRGGPLWGPAGAYPLASLDWATCVLSGLNRQGLRGHPMGYRWPRPQALPDAEQGRPGPVY